MTDIPRWEQQLRTELDEIQRGSLQLSSAVAAVRGRGETRGVAVEVDAGGDIINLQIAPGAMKWTSTQLTAAILDCHRKARADARTQVQHHLKSADPRIREQFDRLRETPSKPTPMSPEEVEAADDAYFKRMNRGGWLQS